MVNAQQKVADSMMQKIYGFRTFYESLGKTFGKLILELKGRKMIAESFSEFLKKLALYIILTDNHYLTLKEIQRRGSAIVLLCLSAIMLTKKNDNWNRLS